MILIGIYVAVWVSYEKVTENESGTVIWNVTEILVESFPFPFGIFFWRWFFGLWYRLRLGSFQDVTCRCGLLY